MSANDYQVGGDHYKSDYIHWDLAINLGLSYLEGCTTKYPVRWRQKNGLEDLKKAWHYLVKLEESSPSLRAPRPVPFSYIAAEVAKFNSLNKLPDLEGAYVAAICQWQDKSELAGAREILSLLLDEAEALEARPVPLTEENHYAERAPICRRKDACSNEEKRGCKDPFCGYSVAQIGW